MNKTPVIHSISDLPKIPRFTRKKQKELVAMIVTRMLENGLIFIPIKDFEGEYHIVTATARHTNNVH